MLSIGSMNMVLPTVTSGINMAHKRCAHSPVLVCLNAPPSFGQKTHGYTTSQRRIVRISWIEARTTGISGDTVHFRQSHCPSGI